MPALDALANPTRRRILELVRAEPRPVRDLHAAIPDISRPAISRHLRLLREAGLVQARAVGTQNVYALRAAGFEAVRAYLEGFWDAALPRYALVAQNLEP